MPSDDDDTQSLNRGHCPDCNHRGFVFGPSAGLNHNIECGNLACRARFNVTIYGLQRLPGSVVHAHRIEREEEGGSTWASKP